MSQTTALVFIAAAGGIGACMYYANHAKKFIPVIPIEQNVPVASPPVVKGWTYRNDQIRGGPTTAPNPYNDAKREREEKARLDRLDTFIRNRSPLLIEMTHPPLPLSPQPTPPPPPPQQSSEPITYRNRYAR